MWFGVPHTGAWYVAWVTFECSDEQRSRWFNAAARSNAGVSEWMCARLDAVEGLPRVYMSPGELADAFTARVVKVLEPGNALFDSDITL